MNDTKQTQYELRKLWDDHEIAGCLYCQAINLQAPNLLGDQKGAFWEVLHSCMHKHTTLRNHLRSYGEIEQKEYNESRKRFRENPNLTRECFEMISELESFLFQVKSSLDVIVKILDHIVGRDFVRTQTYGSEGDSVVKGLEQYKKKSNVDISKVDRRAHLSFYALVATSH